MLRPVSLFIGSEIIEVDRHPVISTYITRSGPWALDVEGYMDGEMQENVFGIP